MQIEGDQVFQEAMLGMTGSKEWEMFINELAKEVYNNQANLLENAQNWDQVVFAKGWNACLAYIINTRDRITLEIQNAEGDTNADV